MRNKGVWFWLFGLSLLISGGASARSPQDSLFEKALDAESAGDVVATITYLEEAKNYDGRYTEEIREILGEYYEALQMQPDEKSKGVHVNFLVQAETGALRYDEYGDSLGAHEYSGEGFLHFESEFEIRRGQISHFLLAGISGSGFLREDSSVLDTSHWAFSPGLEYSVQGERFIASIAMGIDVFERDGVVFSLSASGERDLYSRERFRSGANGFGYWNSDGRILARLGAYVEYKPPTGLWTNVSLAGRFDGDTSVAAYYWRYFPAETGTFYEEGFFAEDSVKERYYLGKNVKLGPDLRLIIGYKFNKAFSVDFWGDLFFSNSPQKDCWTVFVDEAEGEAEWKTRTWNRRLLQGSARLKAHFRTGNIGTHLSIGTHFRRYFDLPQGHPEIFSYAYRLGEVRLGADFKF